MWRLAAPIAGAAVVLATAAAAASSSVPVPAGASTAPARPAPSLTVKGELNAVAAVSACDAWAVGNTSFTRPVTLHWNGTVWKRVASPTIAGKPVLLTGVAATSAGNAWAAGITGVINGAPFIVHWNGTSWRRVATPVRHGAVAAVAATSSRNAWAVGGASSGTLVLHWDGTSWRRVPSPGHGALLAVAAARRSAWAVGFAGHAGFPGSRATNRPLILRWNGTVWRRVPTHLPPGLGTLRGVALTSSGRAWAVGCTGCKGAGNGVPLIESWNGTSWRKAAAPGRASLAGLWAVTATSATNAWAVGIPAGGAGHTTGIVHWDGRTWQTVPSPDPGRRGRLSGVTATSADSAWAVGVTGGSSPLTSVILHWNGTSWR